MTRGAGGAGEAPFGLVYHGRADAGEDGFEARSDSKAGGRRSHSPIVALTAHAMKGNGRNAGLGEWMNMSHEPIRSAGAETRVLRGYLSRRADKRPEAQESTFSKE